MTAYGRPPTTYRGRVPQCPFPLAPAGHPGRGGAGVTRWSPSTTRPGRFMISRMGREAKQGEIAVVIDGKYFGITDYAVG